MKLITITFFAIALAMLAATSAWADSAYFINVNTTSIFDQPGYLELQFNPGATSSAGSAVISNFNSDAILGSSSPIGDVTGTFPSSVTINNTDAWNDYFQGITFGTMFTFVLKLSGGSGNSFALSLWGSDETTPLLTSDLTNGYAVTVDVNPSGPPTVTNYSIDKAVGVSPVPIPSPAWLLGSGLAGIIFLGRRHSRL